MDDERQNVQREIAGHVGRQKDPFAIVTQVFGIDSGTIDSRLRQELNNC